ncbi:unnamed protein product [Eruca vesicaria subsp. sativa]|uniref:Transmembrane protein n=1 Tax=Eruca vesicaria subsp. sativa TaxID=29727 RepID=A0ABC8JRW8_ERUVS|nr:unnamed protein product [Eruca vesicaria subsp. sativa]
MSTYREQASTTVSGDPDDDTSGGITPADCCSVYFVTIIFLLLVSIASTVMNNLVQGKNTCYVDLFAHSISVSNATNVSTADWRTVFIAKSPVTGCNLSLHTVTSRLLRGDEVISQSPVTGCNLSLHTVTSRLLRGDEVISQVSPSLDDFGRLVTTSQTDEPVTNVDFKNVVTPVVNGSVVWDYRVESVVGLKAETAHGYVAVVCTDIPVKFTADAAGNVVGSLLGSMRRCEYSLRDNVNSVRY